MASEATGIICPDGPSLNISTVSVLYRGYGEVGISTDRIIGFPARVDITSKPLWPNHVIEAICCAEGVGTTVGEGDGVRVGAGARGVEVGSGIGVDVGTGVGV
jgi:hypothetical protein